jgi:hypothetical protein
MSDSIKNKIRIPSVATIGAAAAIMLMAPMLAADAAAVHFVGAPTCNIVNGNLECTGKVAGLGNVSTVQAFVEAFVTCTNQGGNIPQGLVKGPQETLTVQNGQTLFDLTIPNPCPDHMIATFTNVALVIDSNMLPIQGTFTATA